LRTTQLTEQIRAADAALFKLFFERPCDIPRFRGMITDDISPRQRGSKV